jgi:hypothetical protein
MAEMSDMIALPDGTYEIKHGSFTITGRPDGKGCWIISRDPSEGYGQGPAMGVVDLIDGMSKALQALTNDLSMKAAYTVEGSL